MISVPSLVQNNFVTRIKSSKTMKRTKSANRAATAPTSQDQKSTVFQSQPNLNSFNLQATSEVLMKQHQGEESSSNNQVGGRRLIESSIIYSTIRDGKKVSLVERPPSVGIQSTVKSSYTSTYRPANVSTSFQLPTRFKRKHYGQKKYS